MNISALTKKKQTWIKLSLLVLVAIIFVVINNAGSTTIDSSADFRRGLTTSSKTLKAVKGIRPPFEITFLTSSSDYFNFYVAGTCICVIFAGVASGLTMGFCCFEPLTLRILLKTGSIEDRQAVSKIVPVLKDHHRILCTLLLFEVIAGESLPVCLSALVPDFLAVLISVSGIFVFCDVIPNAIFTGKHKLRLAARCVPLVRFLLFIFAPIAVPMARLLDCVLHSDDEGPMPEAGKEVVFTEEELAAMMNIVEDASKKEDNLSSSQKSGIAVDKAETGSKQAASAAVVLHTGPHIQISSTVKIKRLGDAKQFADLASEASQEDDSKLIAVVLLQLSLLKVRQVMHPMPTLASAGLRFSRASTASDNSVPNLNRRKNQICSLPDDTPVDLRLLELVAGGNQNLAIVYRDNGVGNGQILGCVRVIDIITYLSVRAQQSAEFEKLIAGQGRTTSTLADVPMLEPLVISEDCSVLTAMRMHREWLLEEPASSRENFKNIMLRGRQERDSKSLFYGKCDLVLISPSAGVLRSAINTGHHHPTLSQAFPTGMLTLNDIMLSNEPKRHRSAIRAQNKARRHTFFPSDQNDRASVAEPESDSDDEGQKADLQQKIEGLQDALSSLSGSNNPIRLQSGKGENSTQSLEVEKGSPSKR